MMLKNNLRQYLEIMLAQTLKSPSALPELIKRTRYFISVVKQGEKVRHEKEKEFGISIPFLCIFSVTWRCNLNCIGCYAMNYSFKEQLSLELIADTIMECRKLGTYFFIVAGGEPLLVEGILDKIAGLRDCFFLFYTNGTLLRDHIAVLKKGKNIFPVISIEGEECSTDLRRGKGVTAKIVASMKVLNDNKIPFGFSAMITHENVKEVTSRAWIDKQWKRGARFGFFTDYVPFKKNLRNSFILTDIDREYKEKALEERNNEAKPPVFNLPPDEYREGQCIAAGRGMIHINADGYVEPCPYSHFAADNIKEKPLKEILGSNFLKELRDLTISLENPKKECMLFSNGEKVKEIAMKTGAFSTEV
jgi:MoaA/NifB/PqqE/SkfB family radical SAM enzyme